MLHYLLKILPQSLYNVNSCVKNLTNKKNNLIVILSEQVDLVNLSQPMEFRYAYILNADSRWTKLAVGFYEIEKSTRG